MGAQYWAPSFPQISKLEAAELTEILEYDQHLAMFLVQFTGEVVLCVLVLTVCCP